MKYFLLVGELHLLPFSANTYWENVIYCLFNQLHLHSVLQAKEYADGDHFLATVRPRDLPECWGVKSDEIQLPGCELDPNSIKSELSG